MSSAAAAVEAFAEGFRYEFESLGNCLGDFVPNRTRLIADATEEPRPMDVCTITIRDSDAPWSRYLRSVGSQPGFAKIFLLPRVYSVREKEVLYRKCWTW